MKSKILMTTALVSLAFASSASALDQTVGTKGNLNVTVGGAIDFRASSFKQSAKFADGKKRVENYDKRSATGFAVNKNLRFDIEGQSDMGLTYGGAMQLEDKVMADADGHYEIFDPKKAYIFVESNMGKIILGMTEGPANSMKHDTGKWAAATGGSSGGDWTYRFAGEDTDNRGANSPGYSATTLKGHYLESATLYMDNGSDKKHANKIVYMTPKFNGLNFGISYAPDLDGHGATQEGTKKFANNTKESKNNGAANLVAPMFSNKFVDVIEVGLAYDQKFGDFGVNASAVGITGQAKKLANRPENTDTATVNDVGGTTRYKNLKGFALGLGADYQGLVGSVSYGSLGNSLIKSKFTDAEKEEKENKGTNTRYWDFGIGYNNGPVGLSLTYLNTERWKNTVKALSFGAQYQLAPGLTPYAEYTVATYASKKHSTGANKDKKDKNSGNVLYIGTALRF